MKPRVIQCLFALSTLTLVFAADPSPPPSPPATPPPALRVSVLRASTERDGIVVRFENRSEKTIRLLRPLDGSEWGWHMPVYDLSITDSAGKAIPLGLRCKSSGLFTNLKWPEDYQMQILPGDAYETTLDYCRTMPATGRFSVSLRYTYDPDAKTTRERPDIKYPGDLWTGTAVSPATTIQIGKYVRVDR